MRAIIMVTILAAGCFLTACSSIPGKLEKLEVGMSKAKMTDIMGSPSDRAVSQNSETLYYTHSGAGAEYYRAFYVELENGKIASFGPVRSNAQNVTVTSAPQIQLPQATYQPIPVRRPINCTTNKMGDTAFTNCN